MLRSPRTAVLGSIIPLLLLGCGGHKSKSTTTATTTGAATPGTTTGGVTSGGATSGTGSGSGLGGAGGNPGSVSTGSGSGSTGSTAPTGSGGLTLPGGPGTPTVPGGGSTGGGSTGGGSTGGGSTGGGSTGGGSTAPSGPALTVSSIANPTSAVVVQSALVPLVLKFEATGNVPVQLTGFTVKATGTISEQTALGALRVVGDDNQNATHEQGEPVMATLPAPAFPRNDASVDVTLTPAPTLAPGQSLQLLLEVDLATLDLGLIGKTLALQVVASGDVRGLVGSVAATVVGAFPLSGEYALQFGEHLMISEIVRTPDSGEFVEIFNPTAATVDLSDVYLTDYWKEHGRGYHNLPKRDDYRPSFFSTDFIARFPQGASIVPGACVVVAKNYDDFVTEYGQRPDYALSSQDPAFHMLTPNSSNDWRPRSPGTIAYGLRDRGETLILFRWDGQSDLVQDLDIVNYGDDSSAQPHVDKGGASVDGPDSDSSPSTYASEVAAGQQPSAPKASSPNNAIRRVDFLEAGEAHQGGNGLTGHDETSENWAATFSTDAPSPFLP